MLQARIDPKKGEWPSDAPDPQRIKEATEVLTATLMQQNDGLDRELRRRVGEPFCLHVSGHCAAWSALAAVPEVEEAASTQCRTCPGRAQRSASTDVMPRHLCSLACPGSCAGKRRACFPHPGVLWPPGAALALACPAQLPGLCCTWQGHPLSRVAAAHDRAAAPLTLRLLCRWQMRGGSM